jgi:hypothetical protein
MPKINMPTILANSGYYYPKEAEKKMLRTVGQSGTHLK